MARDIAVEIVFGTADRQELVTLTVPVGTKVGDAVTLSKIAERFPNHDVPTGLLGIFGRRVSAEDVLKDGDRIEIHRPLIVDPKEARRRRADARQARRKAAVALSNRDDPACKS